MIMNLATFANMIPNAGATTEKNQRNQALSKFKTQYVDSSKKLKIEIPYNTTIHFWEFMQNN